MGLSLISGTRVVKTPVNDQSTSSMNQHVFYHMIVTYPCLIFHGFGMFAPHQTISGPPSTPSTLSVSDAARWRKSRKGPSLVMWPMGEAVLKVGDGANKSIYIHIYIYNIINPEKYNDSI
jgi:hypothetical protein